MSIKSPHSTRNALGLSVLLLLVMLAASCGKKESPENEASEVKSPVPSEQATAPALTDANIVSIVLVANKMDVENAKMALGKTKNPAVKEFANQMKKDHTAAIQQTNDLASKLSLKAEDNDSSRQLEENADATRKTIDESKGAGFDKAYVDNEVVLHQALLDLLDKTLIVGATNAELKSLLENTRSVVAMHLAHAKTVQSSLGG